MRLGLIARADNRGLGVQLWEAYRHLSPVRTMVVDCPSKAPLPLHLERFPGATVVKGFPAIADCREFLDGIDVVYTAETPYNPALFSEADAIGVRSVLHYNHEFLAHLQQPGLPTPTLFAAPSMWRYSEVPYRNKTFLPVPIALDRFADVQRPSRSTATDFLHIVGRPAVADRNGTADLLAALPYVRSSITVTIRCQDPAYVPSLLHARSLRSNIELVIQSADVPDYWENYRVGDVLVMPRRFGGLCLPAQEALGAGMPVIMPDIDPNDTWLPADWLVPATKSGEFMAKTRIDLHTSDPRALAAKIDQFASDRTFFAESQTTAADLAKRNSWDALLPEYQRVLESL